MIFSRSITPIGLELGTATLRAVQLRRRRHRWERLDAIALTRLHPGKPFDTEEAQRLAAVLRRRSFVGNTLAVSLPNQDLIRGLVEVTGKAEGGPMLEAAVEIERTHNLQPGSYELAAWLPPASSTRRQTAVCINGCKHAAAKSLIDAFESAGLMVSVLDSRACAIGRALASPQTPAAELTAVLDIEMDSTELILLHQGSVVYQRPLIDAGLDQAQKRLMGRGLNPEAADHCLRTIGLSGLDHARAATVRKALGRFVQNLLHEAAPAIDYASRIYADLPVHRFAVVGSGAAVPALGYEVQQQLCLDGSTSPLEVEQLDNAATFAVALGLALHPQEVSWAAA